MGDRQRLFFTMLFNGGLVATYYSYVNLFHVQDTIWALIVPNLMMSAFNVILVKNYFRNSIPQSILEAAKIDGASEFGILTRIVVPLSKPIMATVGMMMAIAMIGIPPILVVYPFFQKYFVKGITLGGVKE